jgi:hypothetical protein
MFRRVVGNYDIPTFCKGLKCNVGILKMRKIPKCGKLELKKFKYIEKTQISIQISNLKAKF